MRNEQIRRKERGEPPEDERYGFWLLPSDAESDDSPVASPNVREKSSTSCTIKRRRAMDGSQISESQISLDEARARQEQEQHRARRQLSTPLHENLFQAIDKLNAFKDKQQRTKQNVLAKARATARADHNVTSRAGRRIGMAKRNEALQQKLQCLADNNQYGSLEPLYDIDEESEMMDHLSASTSSSQLPLTVTLDALSASAVDNAGDTSSNPLVVEDDKRHEESPEFRLQVRTITTTEKSVNATEKPVRAEITVLRSIQELILTEGHEDRGDEPDEHYSDDDDPDAHKDTDDGDWMAVKDVLKARLEPASTAAGSEMDPKSVSLLKENRGGEIRLIAICKVCTSVPGQVIVTEINHVVQKFTCADGTMVEFDPECTCKSCKDARVQYNLQLHADHIRGDSMVVQMRIDTGAMTNTMQFPQNRILGTQVSNIVRVSGFDSSQQDEALSFKDVTGAFTTRRGEIWSSQIGNVVTAPFLKDSLFSLDAMFKSGDSCAVFTSKGALLIDKPVQLKGSGEVSFVMIHRNGDGMWTIEAELLSIKTMFVVDTEASLATLTSEYEPLMVGKEGVLETIFGYNDIKPVRETMVYKNLEVAVTDKQGQSHRLVVSKAALDKGFTRNLIPLRMLCTSENDMVILNRTGGWLVKSANRIELIATGADEIEAPLRDGSYQLEVKFPLEQLRKFYEQPRSTRKRVESMLK
jgi:hypothetical protein